MAADFARQLGHAVGAVCLTHQLPVWFVILSVTWPTVYWSVLNTTASLSSSVATSVGALTPLYEPPVNVWVKVAVPCVVSTSSAAARVTCLPV